VAELSGALRLLVAAPGRLGSASLGAYGRTLVCTQAGSVSAMKCGHCRSVRTPPRRRSSRAADLRERLPRGTSADRPARGSRPQGRLVCVERRCRCDGQEGADHRARCCNGTLRRVCLSSASPTAVRLPISERFSEEADCAHLFQAATVPQNFARATIIWYFRAEQLPRALAECLSAAASSGRSGLFLRFFALFRSSKCGLRHSCVCACSAAAAADCAAFRAAYRPRCHRRSCVSRRW
jgi:hypothetical protein